MNTMCQSSILTFLSVAILCFVSLVKGKDTVHCSFNDGPCNWKEVNTNCWNVSRPEENLAGMNGFLYFNNSCQSAEIQAKPLSAFFSESDEEFHFSYYMHGEGEGELIIIDHDFFGQFFGNKPHVSFHCKGDRGPQWYHAHVKIPGGTMFMGILAKTKGSFLIAIDNITADNHGEIVPTEQTCPPRKTSQIFTTESLKTTANIPSTASAESPLTNSLQEKNKEVNTPTIKAEYTTNSESTIRKETIAKRPPSMITKSIQPSESTTQEDSKVSQLDKKDKEHFRGESLVWLKEKKITPLNGKVYTIVGGCIGGIALLICTLITGYFVYKRIRFTSMYSFRRRKLDEQSIIKQ